MLFLKKKCDICGKRDKSKNFEYQYKWTGSSMYMINIHWHYHKECLIDDICNPDKYDKNSVMMAVCLETRLSRNKKIDGKYKESQLKELKSSQSRMCKEIKTNEG